VAIRVRTRTRERDRGSNYTKKKKKKGVKEKKPLAGWLKELKDESARMGKRDGVIERRGVGGRERTAAERGRRQAGPHFATLSSPGRALCKPSRI